jgi:hypothetical protein
MISHYTKPAPKPAPQPVKLVRVYRADDPHRIVILVPASEVVPSRGVGMPDYRLADDDASQAAPVRNKN